ncbi:HsdM family class I SAM-dependent methyltransferase [Parafilimonas terrae]|uniref:site-specific DNA-methyltransferase (adenine-specific) n=1 Tax=Parafilimonas terrae TaxID=1465490 RepID=A0A1I5ZGY9_9BACT|nr:N-6 DNA methylase [Parafilimonas terrae]SFQ55623.1 Type I restriction-modification system, DNA methylase subunit [Parafilimonas terrae]
MANERITEEIVRGHFKNDPLFNICKLEEQKSSNRRINELLQKASKAGKGIGRPEFLISFPVQNSNYLIVVECKGELSCHQSKNLDKPKDFAVDGVLHYSKVLSEDFDVIAIAVSGQNIDTVSVSTFKRNKGAKNYSDLKTGKLLSINGYLKLFNNEAFSDSLKSIDIIQKAVYLNEELHSYSMTENGRCTVVSAVLLGLLDNTFKASYSTYEESSDLASGLIESLKRVLKANKVRNSESMLAEFQKIMNEPLFKQKKIKRKKEERLTIEVLKEFIDYVYKNVYPLITMDDAGIDVLGKFYTEFIRYAGSSQKQGLVLTPFHVTDLFCDLANIGVDDIVYDPCCGSGGFLIAAMKRMLELAGSDTDKRAEIKAHQLVGVERRPDMFTYACSNMMFRGDGKSNIYNGDCFQLENQIIKQHSPNVVFLNPPYDVGNAGQMEFIEHALKVVSKNNGLVVAIVQMSCAIKNEKDLIAIKKRLLQNHRLIAVISMPDEVFSPVTVVTCVMVWEANKPNKNFETWFGYLKDDGFEKRKHKGRLDVKKKWAGIKSNFIKAYHNSKEIPGLSVKKNVSATDEWCAEAYLETDYSTLSEDDFIRTIRDFVSFKIATTGKV